MGDCESQWFKVIVFIVALFVVVIAIINVIYYNRIRNGKAITHGEASSMLILNSIILALAAIVTLWAGYRIILHRETREYIQTQVTKAVTTTEGGYRYSPSRPAPGRAGLRAMPAGPRPTAPYPSPYPPTYPTAPGF